MSTIVLDFETYFDDDYSLSKMTTEEYVRDPRFEVLGMGAYAPNIPLGAKWFPDPKLFFQAADLPKYTVLCHHAQFDGLILSHHFGLKPDRWLDTLSMARMVIGAADVSKSLESLARHYGLAAKNVPYDLFKGKHWHELDAATQQQVADGCLHDCELTYQVFCELAKSFPKEEYRVVDLTVRMFTEPKLVGDRALFESLRDSERAEKKQRIERLGVTEKQLASSAQFQALLEDEGVEVAMKEGKNGPIPAIAKTDEFMRSLLEDENERVQELAEARLAVRSTIDETRAGRLAGISARGPLPVYLNYCGAHTSRWSGGDSTNFQNLGRKSPLRRGLCAPDGYLFAAPDQSQGECRILNWFAGQHDVVERFAKGYDPYIPIASEFYGRQITVEDKAERGTGKQLELSCGFGCGWRKFQVTAARGQYGPPVHIDDQRAQQAIELYRMRHTKIVELWREAGEVLKMLHGKPSFEWRGLRGEGGRLYGPHGGWLDYTTLSWQDGEWRLYHRKSWVKMYGAKLIENVVQWLSRIVTSQAMIRFADAGYSIVGMSHDDVWLLVEDNSVKAPNLLAQARMNIINIMRQTPSWAPKLPLNAECKIEKTYS